MCLSIQAMLAELFLKVHQTELVKHIDRGHCQQSFGYFHKVKEASNQTDRSQDLFEITFYIFDLLRNVLTNYLLTFNMNTRSLFFSVNTRTNMAGMFCLTQ